MITLKLAIAIIAFILSSGQIVMQTFQHHHVVNPKHGGIKFIVFVLSSLSLVYLAKEIYTDFDTEKPAVINTTMTSPAETDYWYSIYKNPSPEGYCAYLEKYPTGQFVAIAKNAIHGDCLQVKRKAEEEARKKVEAEALALKEKLELETKALAEKNAQLEKEAKDNAARIEALEQAKTEAELKAQVEREDEAKLEKELEAKFKLNATTHLPSESEQTMPPVEVENKPNTDAAEVLF